MRNYNEQLVKIRKVKKKNIDKQIFLSGNWFLGADELEKKKKPKKSCLGREVFSVVGIRVPCSLRYV